MPILLFASVRRVAGALHAGCEAKARRCAKRAGAGAGRARAGAAARVRNPSRGATFFGPGRGAAASAFSGPPHAAAAAAGALRESVGGPTLRRREELRNRQPAAQRRSACARRGRCPLHIGREALLLDLLEQRGAIQAEQAGRLVLVPVRALERLQDQVRLEAVDDLVEGDARLAAAVSPRRRGRVGGRCRAARAAGRRRRSRPGRAAPPAARSGSRARARCPASRAAPAARAPRARSCRGRASSPRWPGAGSAPPAAERPRAARAAAGTSIGITLSR